jgi:hypothetical protein
MNRNVGESQPLCSVLLMANSTVPLVAGQPEVLAQLEALMELRELEAGSLLTAKGEEAAREMYFVVRDVFGFVFKSSYAKGEFVVRDAWRRVLPTTRRGHLCFCWVGLF